MFEGLLKFSSLRRARASAPPAPLKTVGLFAGTHRLGDTLVRLAGTARLKETWPQTRLVWLSDGRTPMRTRLFHLSEPYIARAIEGIDMEASTPLEETFDAVLDLDLWCSDAARCRRMLARFRPKIFISPVNHWSLTNIPRTRFKKLKRHSFALSHMEAADLLTGKSGASERSLPAWHPDVRAWQSLAAQALPAGKRYVGFVLGGTGFQKMWPLNRFAEIIGTCVRRNMTPVIFPGEEEASPRWIERFTKSFPSAVFPETHLPAARWEREGVPFAIALAERLDAALANDTGTAHIIAAANIPMVILYSDAVNAKFEPHIDHLQKLIGARHPHPPTFQQIEGISVARVWRALEAALQEAQARPNHPVG